MLSFLLDEQISPLVAVGLHRSHPEVKVASLHAWRDGALMGQEDSHVLRAAHEDGLTLVTYDQRTIPPLLVEWGAQGVSHSGVVFVGEETVAPSDIGGLIRALVVLWQEQASLDWADRIAFLRRS
jgi:predicted nuclease of predicted toxin-antitoxin system